MSVECNTVYPNGFKEKLPTIEPGGVAFITHWHTEDEYELLAVYLPDSDYGGRIHRIEEHEYDPIFLKIGVPPGLLTRDNQIGAIFANTALTQPSKRAADCGRLVFNHVLHPRSLN